MTLALVGGWLVLRDDPAPRPATAPQLAVAGRVFTLHDPATRQARLLDLGGQTRKEVTLAGVPAQARVFGASGHLEVLWLAGERIHIAAVGSDGKLGRTTQFGKRAVALCDGVASNSQRFSVGWRERDNSVWFVFGPTAPAAKAVEVASTVELAAAATVPTTWCTLAVHGNETTLLWRQEGQLYVTACGKRCGYPTRVGRPVGRRAVLGFGCAGSGCALATRDDRGVTHLTWVKRNGTLGWDRVLPGHRGGAVEIIGAGDRQLAVAHDDGDGKLVVTRVSTSGETAEVWRGDSGKAPSLAWIDGVLALAYQHGGRVITTMIALPR